MKYDRNTLKQLHARCRSSGTSAQVGAALEDLVQFVFELIPSVRLFGRDVKDEDGAQEIDLIFSHHFHLSKIPIVDVTVMVECKNEQTRTSSSQVREFGNKLRTRSLRIGILVTAAGLAGKTGSAHAAIRDELGQGSAIIVVTLAELAESHATDDVATLLTDRLMELQTFRTYRSI